MSDLSQDQLEKRASIEKSAMLRGGFVGLLVGLLALWILSGQGAAVQWGGAVVLAGAAGFFMRQSSFKSQSKSAQCEKCGAAFSISRTDRQEVLVESEAKEKREAQENGATEVTTWTEETYEVTDTYTCANCGDETTKTYRTTRRKDETKVMEPAPKPGKSAAAAGSDGETSGSSGKGAAKTGASGKGSAKTGASGKGSAKTGRSGARRKG